MLTGLKVFSEAELVSRFHVRTERYVKTIGIEADTLNHMVQTQILPACFKYYGVLTHAASAAKSAGYPVPQAESLAKVGSLITALQDKSTQLEASISRVDALPSEEIRAKSLAKEVCPLMDELRVVCDQLENAVSDDYWPLPKYREILFIS